MYVGYLYIFRLPVGSCVSVEVQLRDLRSFIKTIHLCSLVYAMLMSAMLMPLLCAFELIWAALILPSWLAGG